MPDLNERALTEAAKACEALDLRGNPAALDMLLETGITTYLAQERCPACGGSGKQYGEPQPDSFGNYTPCDDCEGTGKRDFEAAQLLAEAGDECETCRGTGYHTFDPPVGDQAANQKEPCPDCGGTGGRSYLAALPELEDQQLESGESRRASTSHGRVASPVTDGVKLDTDAPPAQGQRPSTPEAGDATTPTPVDEEERG